MQTNGTDCLLHISIKNHKKSCIIYAHAYAYIIRVTILTRWYPAYLTLLPPIRCFAINSVAYFKDQNWSQNFFFFSLLLNKSFCWSNTLQCRKTGSSSKLSHHEFCVSFTLKELATLRRFWNRLDWTKGVYSKLELIVDAPLSFRDVLHESFVKTLKISCI